MRGLILAAALMMAPPLVAQERPVPPVLAFPERGMDDTAAYRGYRTRFFRDSRGNTLQIYLDGESGRVVHVWADAATESLGFTVRDAAGRPAPLDWGSPGATVSDAGSTRLVRHTLRASTTSIEIGWFQLGSMRVERDVQYAEAHLRPFGAPFYRQRELDAAVAAMGRLAPAERRRHLELLGAPSLAALRTRLDPTITLRREHTTWVVRVTQPSFDGKNRLALELRGDARRSTAAVSNRRTVRIRARAGGPITFDVAIATDAAPLTPLAREEIFSPAFLAFLDRERLAHDTLRARGEATAAGRYPWLEREVRAVELLSSDEKLMAGMPTFATYFGRDMMMSALMMRPIWTPQMSERVIASALRKLGPAGDVSHEEALGGQAIREAMQEYVAATDTAERARRQGDATAAAAALERARTLLLEAQRVRENYHMRDDEFHLPVLAGRWLGDPAVDAARKRAFLERRTTGGDSQLARLLRELALVSRLTAPYAAQPTAENLVAFPKRDSTHWFPGSWRDSDVGYANGRFAMDINAIWAPHALGGIRVILGTLRALGYTPESLDSLAPGIGGSPLREYARNPEALAAAERAWSGAWRHFLVRLGPDEAGRDIARWLGTLAADERRYWEGVVNASGAARDSVVFLAIALDSAGRPIPVANSDPATWLFLGDVGASGSGAGAEHDARVERDVTIFERPFPFGLHIEGLGPVVANDVHASAAVQDMYRRDRYHSPWVVWGREVNLYLLGLSNEIDGAPAARRERLTRALDRTRDAVEASGLRHSELWSYRIENGRLLPMRYGTSGDIQLWSTTDLALQYALARLTPAP